MSTALRIASVTHVLKDLLNNGLIDHNVSDAVQGSIAVTSLPPDKIDTSLKDEPSQLNLFMYHVTYNQGWRNVGQPAFNQKGERVSNPPLAIDLHYFLTAYGSEELHTDILLGYGMQLFHETTVLDREAIRRSIAPPSLFTGGSLPDSLKLLSTSDLAEQAEQIKITPEVLSIEDISKLWAAFGAKYRPTAAYKVTVVLIESSKSTKPSLPVINRNIYVKPFKRPVIEKIKSQSALSQPVVEDQKILSGYRLFLTGKQFSNEIVGINIDGTELDTVTAGLIVDDTQLSFDLPDDLKAGIHEVQVVHPALMGSPPAEHNGVTSSSAIFVLSPQITNSPVVSDISETDGLVSATVTIKVDPGIYTGQKAVLFLNELNGTASYSFNLAPAILLSPPQPLEDVSIQISGVKKAFYLVRIQVENADSPLNRNISGEFISPDLDLT
jgi:Pvc16 N-terminal domain